MDETNMVALTKCPKCGEVVSVTEKQVRSLWGRYTRSRRRDLRECRPNVEPRPEGGPNGRDGNNHAAGVV